VKILLGCINVAYPQIKLVKEQIKAIKQKYSFKGELKWTNVHDATHPIYQELIEYFFMTDMKFRAVIVDKTKIEESRIKKQGSYLYLDKPNLETPSIYI